MDFCYSCRVTFTGKKAAFISIRVKTTFQNPCYHKNDVRRYFPQSGRVLCMKSLLFLSNSHRSHFDLYVKFFLHFHFVTSSACIKFLILVSKGLVHYISQREGVFLEGEGNTFSSLHPVHLSCVPPFY